MSFRPAASAALLGAVTFAVALAGTTSSPGPTLLEALRGPSAWVLAVGSLGAGAAVFVFRPERLRSLASVALLGTSAGALAVLLVQFIRIGGSF